MEPERCAECGFDGTLLTTADAIAALRSMGRRWHEAFADVPDDVLRHRPSADVWSPVEYAAHTRDVLALLAEGLGQVLDDLRPTYPAVEPDPAGPDRSADIDPAPTLDELAANATRIADRAAKALPAHFSRTATLGGQEVDAGWILRHAVHDASHHLRDVERIIGRD